MGNGPGLSKSVSGALRNASKRFYLNRIAREAQDHGYTVIHGTDHSKDKPLHYVTIGYHEEKED